MNNCKGCSHWIQGKAEQPDRCMRGLPAPSSACAGWTPAWLVESDAEKSSWGRFELLRPRLQKIPPAVVVKH